MEVVRVVDFGGTTGSGAGSSCFSVHRKSAAVVFFCTAISYYVVCRPHVSQEIMSGVVRGCGGCFLNIRVRFFVTIVFLTS